MAPFQEGTNRCHHALQAQPGIGSCGLTQKSFNSLAGVGAGATATDDGQIAGTSGSLEVAGGDCGLSSAKNRASRANR
jgi:hypothetical protein